MSVKGIKRCHLSQRKCISAAALKFAHGNVPKAARLANAWARANPKPDGAPAFKIDGTRIRKWANTQDKGWGELMHGLACGDIDAAEILGDLDQLDELAAAEKIKCENCGHVQGQPPVLDLRGL